MHPCSFSNGGTINLILTLTLTLTLTFIQIQTVAETFSTRGDPDINAPVVPAHNVQVLTDRVTSDDADRISASSARHATSPLSLIVG